MGSVSTHQGLCRSQTAWSLQMVKPHRSYCRYWRTRFPPPVSHSHTWPCWCHGWTHLKPGRTLCRWLSAAHLPHRCGVKGDNRYGLATQSGNAATPTGLCMCDDDSPVFKFGHHHNRAKGLLFGNEHVVFHVSEHSRLHEKTWGNSAVLIVSSDTKVENKDKTLVFWWLTL